MGLETNPQKVDDLNEAWPLDGESVEEGNLHLQNIKKAVKARATVNGVYGITTLSSATDSDAEDAAATPAALKATMDAAMDAVAAAADELEDNLQAAIQTLQQSLSALAQEVNNLEIPAAGVISLSEGGTLIARSPSKTAANSHSFAILGSGSVRVRLLPSTAGADFNYTVRKNGASVINRLTTSGDQTDTVSVTLGDSLELSYTESNSGQYSAVGQILASEAVAGAAYIG